MEDSNSQPPRCPCGFWGNSSTNNLCSKCWADHQKKQSEPKPDDASPAAFAAADVVSKVMVDASQDSEPATSSRTLTPTRDDEDTKSDQSDGASGASTPDRSNNGKKQRDNSDLLDPDRPVQKNKKRCFKCKTKLELAFREMGRCKCEYVYCPLHRLPEQHDCIYDHKEDGRREARDKMVLPTRYLGRSVQGLDPK
ncbi:PREDICTED: AN1-type zinc finger protein 3-like [Priapulus caudatus]|uniref:AN1-type zinc finger protein 3-like n=1 Tax=Priapulus caudatus TaxID=37621 RepID=A0ABM1DYP8_PRICU|nr:PREDICTED: AN1-type zinc finger protein 3-like [Priapulus caudatus]